MRKYLFLYLLLPFLLSGCLSASFMSGAIKHTNTKTKIDAMTMQMSQDKQTIIFEIDKTITRFRLFGEDTVEKEHVTYDFPLTHPPKHAELIQFQTYICAGDYESRLLDLPPKDCSGETSLKSYEDAFSQQKKLTSIEYFDWLRLPSPQEKKQQSKGSIRIGIPLHTNSFMNKPILGKISNTYKCVLLIPYKQEDDSLYCYIPDIDVDINNVMHECPDESINIPCVVGASVITIPLAACDLVLLPVEFMSYIIICNAFAHAY